MEEWAISQGRQEKKKGKEKNAAVEAGKGKETDFPLDHPAAHDLAHTLISAW